MELYSALLSDAGWSAKDTVKIKAPHGSEYIRLPEKLDSEPAEWPIWCWVAWLYFCIACDSPLCIASQNAAARRFNSVEAGL